MKQGDFTNFIKIVFLYKGGHVVIDFKDFHLKQDAIFFINAGQFYTFDDSCSGCMIYYNRDFYCVEIHDKEVACDGILFHNVYETSVVLTNKKQSSELQNILASIKEEIKMDDGGVEEMLRTFLKQIIIKCTRIWKLTHYLSGEKAKPEVEFLRSFSQLIEWNYTRHHSVADYAKLLHISPKALNKRITKMSNTSPNDIIKNRILLEAKRLLVHTGLTSKEIGYKLGYEDSSYFIRFFTKQAASSPQNFRIKYQSR
ncbi:MAG: helix-turn-helix domain-containing protein [Flavisolibacter sp.]